LNFKGLINLTAGGSCILWIRARTIVAEPIAVGRMHSLFFMLAGSFGLLFTHFFTVYSRRIFISVSLNGTAAGIPVGSSAIAGVTFFAGCCGQGRKHCHDHYFFHRIK